MLLSPDWFKLGPVSDFLPLQALAYPTPRGAVMVVNVNDVFYAVDDACTHDGGPLSEGFLSGQNEWVCPRHGAHFCLKTGEALSPPAYEPVNTYPVEIKDGYLYIKF